MLCPKCQTENPEGNKFCTSCGTPLVVSSEEQVVPQPTASPPQEAPKSNKSIFIIIGIIVFLLLLIAGLFFVGRRIKQKRFLRKEGPSYSMPTPTSFTTFPKEEQPVTLSKYDIDSDGDAIPDFVEEATGYNPNKIDCPAGSGCGEADVDVKAKKPINVLFILDASGSMAERTSDGEVKMEAAKKAVKDYIDQTPAEINVGLMVYGHKGSNSPADKAISCAGIEILSPIGTVDKEQFKAAVDSFSPTGWTAIGTSLRKARDEAFAGKNGENNFVIVVSDGIETCDSDPISAAQELRQSGIEPTIDVIGFAVDAQARSQLEQIAKIGEGEYYSAATARQLREVMDSWWESLINISKAIDCVDKNFNQYWDCVIKQYMVGSNNAWDYLENIERQKYRPGEPYSDEDLKEIEKINNVQDRIYQRWRSLAGEAAGSWEQQRDIYEKQIEDVREKTP